MIADDIDTLDPQELRERLRKADAQLVFQKSIIDKLTHENAILKRLKFAARSEVRISAIPDTHFSLIADRVSA